MIDSDKWNELSILTDPQFIQTSKSDIELINDALNTDNYSIYISSIRELHVRGSLQIFDIASSLCKSDSYKKRELGVNILGQLGTVNRPFQKESVDLLISLLQDKNDCVLRAAIIALGHRKDMYAIDDLIEFLGYDNAEIKADLADSIGRCLPESWNECCDLCESGIDALIKLSNDSDATVRANATFQISHSESNSVLVLDALYNRVSDNDGIVRSFALLGLVYRKAPDIIPLIKRELESPNIYTDTLLAAANAANSELLPLLNALKDEGIDSPWLDYAIQQCSDT